MIGFNAGGSTTSFEEGLGGASAFASQLTTAGADRIAFVAYMMSKSFASVPTGTLFEWGSGNPMTVLGAELSLGTDLYVGVQYLLAPPTGLTTIGITDGRDIMCAGAFSAFGVDQVTPFSGSNPVTGQAYVDVASNPGELALACAFDYTGSGVTASAPATQIGTILQSFFSINTCAAYDAGANPTTTISFSSASAVIGVSLKPAGGGGGGGGIVRQMLQHEQFAVRSFRRDQARKRRDFIALVDHHARKAA